MIEHVDDAKLRGLFDRYGRCTEECASNAALEKYPCNCGFRVAQFFMRWGGKEFSLPDLKEIEKDMV